MTGDRKRQLLLNVRLEEKCRAELARELDILCARADYRPEFGYFLELFRYGHLPEALRKRVDRPIVNLLCVGAPLELFAASGLHPYKVFSGSLSAAQVAAVGLPALMCPMLKAALGALELETAAGSTRPWVLPTTCDWVVKFQALMGLGGLAPPAPLHWLELPHLKDSPRGRARWQVEIAALRDFLAGLAGLKPTRRALLDSLADFRKTRRAFSRLIEARRAGRVPAVWFSLIANSFFLDRLENWTAALEAGLSALDGGLSAQASSGAGAGQIKTPTGVFLAGSPIFFPNFKLLYLLEEAGLAVLGDDLCSSERIFPAQVAVDDPSEFGLMRALGESYHQGCLCPTFGDNERRLNNILGAAAGAPVKGVVFQVLKGCHPHELESLSLEEPLKRAGLRFIKLETDYTAEDTRNLLTRLEAFAGTLY